MASREQQCCTGAELTSFFEHRVPDEMNASPRAIETDSGAEHMVKHISVCICTYKRPELLQRLLKELGEQETNGEFTYSIVVADNDAQQSGKDVASQFAAISNVRIVYCAEPLQNIPLARNKAIEHSSGDFIAFIDDDEFPSKRWLLTLFNACQEFGADGVVGPVMRHFDETPPKWILKGGFYERPTYATGFVIDWTKGRTNNVLLNRRILVPGEQPFRSEFRTGEDQDFFRRMIGMGRVFVWCNEAEVYEVVPPVRWRRSIILRRALLRGTVSVAHPTFGWREIAASLVAIPIYVVALPVAGFCGHHRFMTLAEKLCEHTGRLLALVGIDPVKEPYVTG
jgi:succinoglycan biosynthesis protein ExoM